MSTSSDERIQRHKQKQTDAVEAQAQQQQRAAEQRQRKDRFLAELRAKWANDTKIIVEILQDFGTKLDGRFHFSDLGAPPPNAAARARITGNIGKGSPISIDLTVDEQGQLHAAGTRQVGPSSVRLVGSHPLMVTDAQREQYEEFILDRLGIEN
jgi:hypothetical protein